MHLTTLTDNSSGRFPSRRFSTSFRSKNTNVPSIDAGGVILLTLSNDGGSSSDPLRISTQVNHGYMNKTHCVASQLHVPIKQPLAMVCKAVTYIAETFSFGTSYRFWTFLIFTTFLFSNILHLFKYYPAAVAEKSAFKFKCRLIQ